jgi:hypothetical protein
LYFVGEYHPRPTFFFSRRISASSDFFVGEYQPRPTFLLENISLVRLFLLENISLANLFFGPKTSALPIFSFVGEYQPRPTFYFVGEYQHCPTFSISQLSNFEAVFKNRFHRKFVTAPFHWSHVQRLLSLLDYITTLAEPGS